MSLAVKNKPKKLKVSKLWLELLNDFYPLLPIGNKAEYEYALSCVSYLMDQKLNATQKQYLSSLVTIVEDYENKHYEIDVAGLSTIDIVRNLCHNHDMTASDLGKLLGDRSLGTRILKGQRELSKNHIHSLCEHFKVSPALFC